MKPKLQGILLDLDETLYSRDEAFWGWLEHEGRAAPASGALDRQKVAELDQSGRGDKQALLEYLESIFEWRQTHQERLQRFRAGIGNSARLAPGVRESLTRLAGHYKLGLVTNGTGPTQRAKLEALALDALFDP